MSAAFYRLASAVKDYPWGSHTAIAAIRGLPVPSAKPEAELWMGAHEDGPSRVDGTRSLVELIADEPASFLGGAVAARFDGKLPFLMKILAAARPLSLQAHPNLEQAREGFERESRAGVALFDASGKKNDRRNYKDRNHKPELICALSPFSALVGFRPPEDTARLLESLAAPPLAPLVAALRASPSELRSPPADAARVPSAERALRDFFELATAPDPEGRLAIARATRAACERLAGKGGEFSRELAWGARIGETFVDDPGIVVALALNLMVLEPGDAVYLPAGNLHAYLEGTGVEIMASSDNVLRGGLTTKHVDVPELIRVLDFRPFFPELVAVEQRGAEHVYSTPAPEFSLSRFELSGERVAVTAGRGPEILVVTAGAATLERGAERLELASGESVFLPNAGGDYALGGRAQLFRARVNDSR